MVDLRKRFESKNATLRWSVARHRLDGGDTYTNESPQVYGGNSAAVRRLLLLVDLRKRFESKNAAEMKESKQLAGWRNF